MAAPPAQIRMEYMQRCHTVTGYAPNKMLVAHKLRLPLPVGTQDAAPRVASMQVDFEIALEPDEEYVRARDEESECMVSRAYDNILGCRSAIVIARPPSCTA